MPGLKMHSSRVSRWLGRLHILNPDEVQPVKSRQHHLLYPWVIPYKLIEFIDRPVSNIHIVSACTSQRSPLELNILLVINILTFDTRRITFRIICDKPTPQGVIRDNDTLWRQKA